MLRRFFRFEAASGVLMVIAAAVAVGVANSGWHAGFERLWLGHPGALWSSDRLGGAMAQLSAMTVRDWVNDAGLALFFLLAGLEVKRQLVVGELRDRRAALLPVLGALGGMIVPAAIYLAMRPNAPASQGWGTTVATDLALAAGVVIALGNRVPAAVRVFILTLAVVDDIGGVIVVAVFYGGGVGVGWMAVVAGCVGLAYGLRRVGVVRVIAFVPCGVVAWYAMRRAGIEPALCGVLFGLLMPVTSPASDDCQDVVVGPMERVEAALNPAVSFVILPIFALANSGVRFTGVAFDRTTVWAVVVARVVGKVVGIAGLVWVAQKLGWGRLGRGMTLRHVVGLGLAAGMGFTISLFVSEKAFTDGALVASAKAGTLISAAVAGVLSFIVLRS